MGGIGWPETHAAQVTAIATATGFEFRCAGQLLWRADTRWLADPATIRAVNDDNGGEVLLPHCRVPAVGLALSLRIRLDQDLRLTVGQAGDAVPASVALADWLSSANALAIGTLRTRLRARVGNSLVMRQRQQAQLALFPDFRIGLDGRAPVFLLQGDEISGECSNCVIGPAGDGSFIGGSHDAVRLEFISLDANQVRTHPSCLRTHFQFSPADVTQLLVDLPRVQRGARASAYAVRFARPLRATFRPGTRSQDGYATLADVTYAVHTMPAAAPSYLLLADRADVMLRVGDTAYHGRAAPSVPFRLQSDGQRDAHELSVLWHGMTTEHAHGISCHIRFEGKAIAAGRNRQLEHLLDNIPWPRKRLELDDATIEFSRAADALLLRFRFSGFDLVRHPFSSHLRLAARAKDPKMLLDLGSQSISEQAFFESSDARLAGACDSGTSGGSEPIRLPAQADLAGASVLAFSLRQQAGPGGAMPLDLPSLLDRAAWQLVVAPRASDKLHANPAPCSADPAYWTSPYGEWHTSLEIPWRLYVSPSETAVLSPSPLQLSSAFGLVPLFSLSLLPPTAASLVGGGSLPGEKQLGLPLRAIGSPDYLSDDPVAGPADRFTRDLQASDRNQLVWLTSTPCQQALLGSDDVRPDGKNPRNGIYVPRPFYAERLLLTSFGASLRSAGTWDPPTLYFKDTNKYQALRVMQWNHMSTLGRDHHCRIVSKGFLLPYGHYATLIKETWRELRDIPGEGLVAVQIKRNYLSVVQPTKTFPTVGQPTASLFQTFHPEKFTITLPGQLQLDNPCASQINGRGESAFWIRVRTGEDFLMPIKIGDNGQGHVTMAFVDNNIVHDLAALQAVVAEYNATGSRFHGRGSRVRFAPETKPGDTSFPAHDGVHKVVVAAQLVNSVLLESARPPQPPFYPVLDNVYIELNGAARVQGQAKPPRTRVRYADVYRNVGFGTADGDTQAGNPLQLFLQLDTGVPLNFTGNSERSGGIATPNMTATAYSRSHGLVARSALPPTRALGPAAVTQSLQLNNPFDLDAKLLGLLPLGFFFESVGLGELPQLVESVAYRIDTAEQQFEKVTQAFMSQVADAMKAIHARLDEAEKADPIAAAFLGSDAGKALKARLERIEQSAQQASRENDAVRLVQDMERVASELRLLQKDFDALAELPQALEQSIARQCVDVVSKQLPGLIEKRLVTLKPALLAAAKQAAEDATALANLLYFETACDAGRDILASYMAEIAEAQAEALRALLRLHRAQLDKMAQQLFASNEADQFVREALKYLQLASDLQAEGIALRRTVLAAGPVLEGKIKACVQAAVQAAAADFAANLLAATYDLAGQIERWMRDIVSTACPQAYMQAEPSLRELVRRARVATSIDQMQAPDPLSRQLARFNACRSLLDAIGSLRAALTSGAAGCITLPALPGMPNVVDKFVKIQAQVGAVSHALDDVARAIPTNVNDFASSQLRTQFKKLADLGRTYDFRTFDERAMAGVLDAVTGALDRRLVPGTVTAAIGAIDALQRDASAIAQAVWPSLRAVLAYADQQAAALKTAYDQAPKWQQNILDCLLGKQLFIDLGEFHKQLGNLLASPDTAANLDWIQLAAMADAIGAAVGSLEAILVHLATALRGLDRRLLDEVREQVRALAAELVPARTSISFDLSKRLDRPYGGVFLPGLSDGASSTASFMLNAKIDVDLMQQLVTAQLSGLLSEFRINLMSVMVLPVREIRFQGGSGGFHLDPPVLDQVTLLPPLDFIQMIQAFLGTQDGLFVTPGFNQIRAGYRFSWPVLQAGPVTFQNLLFEAAMEIPFDDRPALFSVACGTRTEPCLVSVGIYGGGFFLELVMAGSHLVSIESDFCFGLVGGFSLPAVKGTGRIVVQINYRQSSGGTSLSGFFYAGGSARVLGIVSISADLHVPLAQSGSGASSNVGGASTFGITIGAGPFKWTLHFPVSYGLGMIGSRADRDATASTCKVEHQRQPDPVDLLQAQTWKEYVNAFESRSIEQ
jgi:hypothetical protein